MRENNEQLPTTHHSSSVNWAAQTPALGSIPRFFYTTTCPGCLDPVAQGNQIAESELRKPHPACGNPRGPRLPNSHSDLCQALRPASRQAKLGPRTHTPAAACCHPLPRTRPFKSRAGMGRKRAAFFTRTVAGDNCVMVRRVRKTRG